MTDDISLCSELFSCLLLQEGAEGRTNPRSSISMAVCHRERFAPGGPHLALTTLQCCSDPHTLTGAPILGKNLSFTPWLLKIRTRNFNAALTLIGPVPEQRHLLGP